ncbi:MAG: hypothetical protein ABR508_11340, partial [Candidatus Baltobacteraceae bacterium]
MKARTRCASAPAGAGAFTAPAAGFPPLNRGDKLCQPVDIRFTLLRLRELEPRLRLLERRIVLLRLAQRNSI